MNVQELGLAAARRLSKQKRLTDWLGANTSWENPFGDERARYPYPIFERERKNGPVYWHRLYNAWVVLGYEECQEVLASPDFSSGAGMAQVLTMHPYKRLSPGAREFVANMLIFADGETHARLRALVSRAFTPRKVTVLEPRIREIAATLLWQVGSSGTVDVFDAYTSKLPVHVIGELLGIPQVRWPWLRQVSTELTKLFDPIRGFDPAEMETAIRELRGYIMALVDTRRDAPTDDLLSALVAVDEAGDRLTTDEMIGLIGTLILAGSETTTGLMGNAIVKLANEPDQRTQLAADPALWPNAIEEFLRYDPPVTFVPRAATRDTMLGDIAIKEGQTVEVMIAAANRDPRRYDEPGELRIDRTNPTPLSFGHGIHFCIGAALARSTARIGLQTFVETFGAYTIDPAAVEWRTSSTLRGPTMLPVSRGADAG